MPTADRVVQWICGVILSIGLLNTFVSLPISPSLNLLISVTILAVGVQLVSFGHVMLWVRVIPLPVLLISSTATFAAILALWATIPRTYQGVTVFLFVTYWLVMSAFEYAYYDV